MVRFGGSGLLCCPTRACRVLREVRRRGSGLRNPEPMSSANRASLLGSVDLLKAGASNTAFSGFAGLDEPGFVGEHDGLDAVAEVELGEDPVYVCLDGGCLDNELLGDLGVGEPARE